ncbi:uncharacterized protein tasor2 isoform X2 [Echeneis naucrates]|uniref:uncharacterized protein tasor2 isoform X2 n=1 Tax=Echeneis naucrates TaxID=173247 RepID=UPI001113FCEB|nr:uncharacterized protein LOC115056504 isoform X2 [Echeneis naucrates]
MESGNGGASSKGVLVPVSDTSDEFRNGILAPLQSAYLYEESHLSFKYKSAVLVKNPALEKKYNTFRAKKRAAGYSEEDLEETYGFLLFDDVSEAHALGDTGVHTRNGTCTTLGDPCKGVYISMYSDCLDLNRWYHGKSGYIAIIRLTKGKVKKVLENYTQNFTAPTVGFDCHVSEQLPSVSAQTSSFLAFERTQYYMYELIGDESDETAQSPSAACPFAIVSFSYTDTDATFVVQPETSEKKKQVCHYLPWKGKLQIGNQFYNVTLRSTGGALIPAKLPPVLKVDRAISMSNLIQLLPKGVFETFFCGEVSLDNLYCSVCELISSDVEETSALSLLLEQIKEKDLALPVRLNDRGLLILLHSSHVFTYDDTGSNETEVLQGMFVFPDSRAIQRGTKSGQRKATASSDILWILPVLTYAESEAEKTLFDASEELCEVLAQHIQNYATLINPGLPLSPSREVNMFPDQYDVLDTHNHLYSTPDWTKRAWENLRSYMSKPDSFQLPVSRASEILAAGQEERREDLDDDVYICLSSPEEAPASPIDMGSEDRLSEQTCPVNSETPAHSCLTNAGALVDSTNEPQTVALDDMQAGDTTKDKEKTEMSIEVKTDDAVRQNLLIHPTSDDLSAELIVSITSAEQTLTDESISVISTVSATKQNEFQLSGFSAAKLQTAEDHCLHDGTVQINNKGNDETNAKKRKGGKLCRRPPKGFKKAPKASGGNVSLPTVKIPGEVDISMSQKDEAKELSGNSKLNAGPLIVDWRKLPRRRRKFGKLSTKSKKVRAAAVRVAQEKNSAHDQQSSEVNVSVELEICPLRKKTERWDIKPVVSECGRILVPFGSVDVADRITCMKDKPEFAKDEQHTEKLLVEGVNAHATVDMEQDYGSAPEAALDERVATTSKDGANPLQNVVTGHNKTEDRLLKQSDCLFPLEPESNERSLDIDSMDTFCPEPVREKLADPPSQRTCASKGDFLLNKLKSVLLRGKRKNNFLVSGGMTTDAAQNIEPCMKKGKGETDAETLKSNDAVSSLTVISESVDPVFAYALGLTPRVKPIQVQESQDSQVWEVQTETKEQTLQVKHPEIIQRPPSIFQRRSRIKKIRRHQGIPTEYIKKKCTPFQVSPLSGSTRLLQAYQQLYGDGIQTLHPTVCHEDKLELNRRTPEHLKKHMPGRRKFRHSRTFVKKGASIQVTREWNENYDFNRDSRFSNDFRDRTVVRALHGPWDYSIQDTAEEVQLIVHIWIGLFYSRSTARFFQMDSNGDSSEGSDSVEMSTKMVPAAPVVLELKANSFGASSTVADKQDPSPSKALDLSKKDNSSLDQESAVLDLSLKNGNSETVAAEPQVSKRGTSGSSELTEASETVNTMESSAVATLQCHKTMVHSTEKINDMSKVGDSYEEDKSSTPSQNAGFDKASFKDDGLFSPLQEETEKALLERGNVATASGTGHVSHGCSEDNTSKNDDLENLKTSLAQKHEKNSCESMRDKNGESDKEADKVAERDYIKSKVNWEVKENSSQKRKIEAFLEVIDQEKQISTEEPKSVSSSYSENDDDVDCGTEQAGEITTGQDGIGEGNVLDETDCCVSAAVVEGDLSEQPLSIMCESPGSVKKDCIPDCCCQAPSQANHEDAACRDFQLRELPTNGHALAGEKVLLGKVPVIVSEMEQDDNQTTSEDMSENDICLADKVQHQTVELPTSLESCQAESIPKTKDSLEEGRNSDHTTSAVEKKEDGSTAQEEAFHSNPHSPQDEAVKKCEAFETLTKETDLAMERTNERLEMGSSGILIPFIGLDISGEDMLQPNIPQQQSKVEEAVQSQKEMPIINNASYFDMIREISSTAETRTLSADKVLLLGTSETNHEMGSGSECDNRCPTPTLDERPYDWVPCSGPCRSTSAFSSNESYKTHECLNSSKPVDDEMPCEQKLQTHPTVGSDQKPLHPDLELRTLRVLQSIDKLLCKPSHIDKVNQMETAHMKNYIDQTPNLDIKHTPACVSSSHTSADFKKMSNKLVEASPSTSHELHKQSPDHFIISPFKSKLEKVLGVRLQLKKTDSPLLPHNFERGDQKKETSVGQDYCHSYTSVPSEGLHTFTSNINQGRHKTAQQSNLNLELRSHSQRPVMAVKPSKSDECQVHCNSKDGKIQYSAKSDQTETSVAVTATPTTTANKTEHFSSGLIDDRQESRESCLSNVVETKSNSERAKLAFLDPANQDQIKDTKISPSSLSTESFESVKSDGHQGSLSCSLLEKVEITTEENREVDPTACSEASSSFVEHKDSAVIGDLGPQSSLVCTIFNTNRKRSHFFLDQVSQQCLQDDITQVSLEKETLIFSEQMKQLLKRNKREDVYHKDSQDKSSLSCTSPVTVCFSSLEEQEDSGEFLDTPLLDGQKFKVDVSDRKSMADSTEERTLHLQKSSPAQGRTLKEHAGVSDVTAECVRLYEEKMNDICAVQKVQSRPTNFTMDTSYTKPEPSSHFDFCYKMKREMDESFRSCLNSVVKKSCKTKNKFYILVTSDDELFEETKAHLEAEGHTAVQPSEFFLSEDSSASLLIILRNEDIAEHICEVPHLLELKKSPGVQFAGIDEPDDVVNLTYQELFVQGGFVMLDMAVLETLSICDMRKFAEVLRELRRTGKWKWMLHYRNSRRLKEKSRVSEEVKEKKQVLNSCQETGILEVLPYHECDLMSRDQPDYLTCLIRLQVQNISARYPIFITDTTANGTFGRNGILTMTMDSFLTNSINERFCLT